MPDPADAMDESEDFLSFVGLLFGLLSVGNVLYHSGHAHRRVLIVEFDRPFDGNPSQRTVSTPSSIACITQRLAAVQKACRCTGQQKRLGLPRRLPTESAPPSTVRVVTAVSVSLALAAAAKVAGDSTFGADALAAAIKSELRARKLLNEKDPRASGTAQVTIEDLNSHPTSNAVLFGYQMMAGPLTGDVHVDGASGNDSPHFRIVAASRWKRWRT